jgi:uncharacterized protein YqgC (DUF456 family)
MTLVLDFTVMLWMLAGLACTLLPKLPGTLIIYAGAIFYGYFTDFSGFGSRTIWVMSALVCIGEFGGRALRQQLIKGLPFSPGFSTNTTVGNVAGIIVSDALLGMAGLIVWQMIAGKTLYPRWDTVNRALVRMMAAAIVRFVCGMIMIGIFFFSVIL